MGNIATKCLEVFDGNRKFDINKEDNDKDNILNQDKASNSHKNKLRKNNIYNINDILAPANTITNKVNDKNNENNDIFNNNIDNNNNDIINERDNIDLSKITKIQNTYHKHYLKNKFETKIKPSIAKKTSDHLDKLYSRLSSQGDVSQNVEEFSPDNWKLYYPSDDPFFLFEKGDVYQNQIRIKNQDDLRNLEIYEGEMNKQNKKHGNGILSNNHHVLKGTWRDDQFTGWGIKCKRNGDNFEGKFIDGELNGKGIFKNGNNLYKGDFVNNERCGQGELTTDKYYYKGEFKNDKLEGIGEISFFENGDKYEGTFSNNNINGKGVYKRKNGDIYEGEMKNGKMDGFGKYTFGDGKIYEGEFVNDLREGNGKLSFPDGKSYEGNFVNGDLDGEVICKENNKTLYKVLFSRGKLTQYL